MRENDTMINTDVNKINLSPKAISHGQFYQYKLII